GAIPGAGQYRVVLEPEGTLVGSLDEDFAIEANGGDIFQLGNASWRILRVEPGTVRVADAQGAPPTVPFWFGEAPARTRELSAAIAVVREGGRDPAWLEDEIGLSPAAATQLSDYLREGEATLGAIPTPTRVVLLPRTRGGGKRVPTPLLRMRAEDLLVRAFPQVLACPETLPPGEMPVPWGHPMVRQTIEDCLTEAMDVEGFLDVLHGLRDGRIEK